VSAAVAGVSFEERLGAVRARIARAAERSGRTAGDVTLIAVSKTWPAASVLEAFAAGVREFGENRVQEGESKAADVAAALGPGSDGPNWHLIGHLQSNKVRAALATFSVIHSVDSERLLRAISAAATKPVALMLEVNVSGEASKFGVTAAELPGLLEVAAGLPNVEVRGLMTVAPQVDEAGETRPVFRELARLAAVHKLRELSMGMTNDYEVAIEEGATHVRVGRALFGDRQ